MSFLNISPRPANLALISLCLCAILRAPIGVQGGKNIMHRRNVNPNQAQDSPAGNVRINVIGNDGLEDTTALPGSQTAATTTTVGPQTGAVPQSGVVPSASALANVTVADPAVTHKTDSKSTVDPSVTPLPTATVSADLNSSANTHSTGVVGSDSLQDATGKSLIFPIMDSNGRVILQSPSDIRPASGMKTENATSGTSMGKGNLNSTDFKGTKMAKKGAKGSAGALLGSIPSSLIGSISLGLIMIFFA